MASPVALLLILPYSLLTAAFARPQTSALGSFPTNVFANGALLRCPMLVSRSNWNARGATNSLQARTGARVSATILQITPVCATGCTNESTCAAAVRRLQTDHMRQPHNWADIAFHFLIAPDGKIFRGRAWNQPGPSNMGSPRALHVAFLGNYAHRNINLQEVISLWSLMQCLQQRHRLTENYALLLTSPDEATCNGRGLFRQIRRWQRAGQLPQ